MADTKYGKYIRTQPVTAPSTGRRLAFHSDDFNEESGSTQSPGSGVYLNGDAFPGYPIYFAILRTSEAPAKQPDIYSHKHDDADEIILFVAAGPDAELGTNVTIEMGEEGEKHTFHETTVVYAPKGVYHGPIWYSTPFKEGKEFYLMAYLMQPYYPVEED